MNVKSASAAETYEGRSNMNLLGEYASVGDPVPLEADEAPSHGNREGNDSAHAWRLEKRRSKYVKARQFLEEQFAETGIECPVRSLEGLTFATWKEFHEVLQEYMKETNQIYISRDSKTTLRYNAEQMKRKVKNFIPIPIDFTHARIRFDCKHSHSNMSKNMNLLDTKNPNGKDSIDDNAFLSANPKRKAREGSFYSACPVKMHVQVHKNASTMDEWRVIVTNHVHVHNHDLVHNLLPEMNQEQRRTLPYRLDDAKKSRALTDLCSFFTAYQHPKDDESFHRRYSDLYMYIYQCLNEDKCAEADQAMQQFKKLPKPPTQRKEKRKSNFLLPPPPSLLPAQHYQL